MFGFHAPELIIILVVALLIFGPKKLPEMGRSIGKGITEFRKGMSEISQPKEDDDDDEDVSPKALQKPAAGKSSTKVKTVSKEEAVDDGVVTQKARVQETEKEYAGEELVSEKSSSVVRTSEATVE